MKRRHNMPFGAECRDDGSIRYRLWAPAAHSVHLEVTKGKRSLRMPLHAQEAGWYELVTDAVQPGAEYIFQIDDGQRVPDPASRFQGKDVHAPSEVIDPAAFDWKDLSWRGRPWEEAVIYELHVGTFTPAGTFTAVRDHLDYLADIGVTAVELMPVADFAGKRNWGYDGVYPFAPESSYGRPEDLKELVQSAHNRGLMILLDVVYNHFGPEGNYLACYAPQFFTQRHHTPWGDGINFDSEHSRPVRDFFVNNALYWLHEFNFDGLRFDAVHAIADDSKPDILTELADTVRKSIGPDRHVHLILENDRNQSRYLERKKRVVSGTGRQRCEPETYTAQWNDDIHHTLHVLLTGEKDGYYLDYSQSPIVQLGRCLTEGFAYQGEASDHRNGAPRGEATAGLSMTAFVSFLQNHDQVGNRAFGDRITKIADLRAVRAAMAMLLLAPSPPMLFMGEEFGADSPFLFFCDFEKDLATAVTNGRRNEFAHFAAFSNPADRERIPDPNALSTFEASRLDWDSIKQQSHQALLNFYRELLKLRREKIVPLLARSCSPQSSYELHGDHGLSANWRFEDGAKLTLLANLGSQSSAGYSPSSVNPLYVSEEGIGKSLQQGRLPAWSVAWYLES